MFEAGVGLLPDADEHHEARGVSKFGSLLEAVKNLRPDVGEAAAGFHGSPSAGVF